MNDLLIWWQHRKYQKTLERIAHVEAKLEYMSTLSSAGKSSKPQWVVEDIIELKGELAELKVRSKALENYLFPKT